MPAVVTQHFSNSAHLLLRLTLMKNIRNSVLESLESIAKQQGQTIDGNLLDDELVLAECGLDSLGFAILVAELEIQLGYDPFVLMDEPHYPKTTGELIAAYERFKNHARG
jgi:acyl carrier protein